MHVASDYLETSSITVPECHGGVMAKWVPQGAQLGIVIKKKKLTRSSAFWHQ
jgi:hypothetical protein